MFGHRKRPPKPPPAPCPECGKPTNLGGRFCRACGWDADHAGSADAHLDGVSVPEAMDDEAYEDLLEAEGIGRGGMPRGRRLFVAAVVLVLLVAFVWSAVLWNG